MPANPAPVLYIVVPCYNEEEVLPETAKRLWKKLRSLMRAQKIDEKSRVLFANDGSKDRTWEIITKLHDNPNHKGVFTGITLAHNRGHQNVLYAGLMSALERGCDAAISMDADLQDDINAIDGMVDEYLNGADIVFGVRDNRDTDTAFKRGTAGAFYKVMRVMGTETVPNSADFRLMDKRALEALAQYGEANLFLRGIVPTLGFNTANVYYQRAERFAGESKYPLSKMIGLAVDGITSFSVTPLRMVTMGGVAFLVISIIMLIYALVSRIAGVTVSGWTSLLVSIWFVGGALMVSLGTVGEYVGRIYIESKHRPRYIIADELS